MKKISVLWLAFVGLSVLIVFLSHTVCVVSTSALPPIVGGGNELSFEAKSIAQLTVFPTLFGSLVLLYRNTVLHIIQIIAEVAQTLWILTASFFMNSLTLIGGPSYESTPVAYVTAVLSVITTTICIRVMIRDFKEKRRNRAEREKI